MADPQVVVVGAGAAGIGAALELAERGIASLVLEASNRVGGRARTEASAHGTPWDHGCHWFHSADINPLVAWADRLGVDYRRQVRVDHFMAHRAGRWADAEGIAAARAALNAAFDAIYAAGEDLPITQVLPDAGVWEPGVRLILRLMTSEEPERVSALNYADYRDTDTNWPVTGGYGTLIGRMAAGLDVRTGVPVTEIRQEAGGVRVETPAGTLMAKAAIVTASTNVLIGGGIAFGPGPARDLMGLIADVPCGAYEKVAVSFRAPPIEPENKTFCMIDPGDGGTVVDFQVNAGDRRVLISHMAGDDVRAATRDGPDGLVALCLERLAGAFGSAIRGDIVATQTTAWLSDPWVRGAYSYAKPGAAALRHRMIAADTGPVAFAGEAFSPTAQSTAHGAYESGRAAAARIAERLVTR